MSYNAWKLVSLSPLAPWALVALCVAIAAGIGFAVFGLRKEPSRGRRLVLWTLRIAAGVCALFFLLEPGIRQLQVARMKNRVAVVIDRSASMGFPSEPGGPTRAEEVARYLKSIGPELAALQDRFTVDLFGAAPELAPISLEALSQEPPRGGKTDLLGALRAVKAGDEGASGKKLSGVLLFSDGADNVDLRSGVTGPAKDALEELGVPVSTFVVGKGALKDLAIEAVKVDDFAFVRNALQVEVQVRGRGFRGTEIPVVLRREGQVVATRSIQLESNDDLKTVQFQFTPDQTGRFVYTAEVPVFPEEVVVDNNEKSFVLKVIRDRVKVLFVVGRPSWDERFLRGLLRQDANVDLISFYILRTLSDDTNTRNPDRELSLIPFPMEEIFREKLHTFDVVVFQNFGYTDPQLSIEQYETELEQYVYGGGAFVMIGGDHSFGEGRVSFPTLGRAIPLEGAGLGVAEEPFKPRLTSDGRRHPVTAVATGSGSNEAAWDAMPELSGSNLVRAKPGATVLLDHPTKMVDGKPAPILALWDYGRGRSMALAVDSSWAWAFTSHQSGSSNRLYDRFWGNALRWLVRDPDLTTLKITADPASVEPGKPVGAIVVARTPDYQPAPGAQVKVDLLAVKTQKVLASRTVSAGADGTARAEFPPPAPGAYKVVAHASLGERSLGDAEDAVAVRAVGPELADASVHSELLEKIAQATGGRAYELPRSGLPQVPLLEPQVVEVGRSKDEPFWDRWYYLVALVTLLGAEWLLRRRFGYI